MKVTRMLIARFPDCYFKDKIKQHPNELCIPCTRDSEGIKYKGELVTDEDSLYVLNDAVNGYYDKFRLYVPSKATIEVLALWVEDDSHGYWKTVSDIYREYKYNPELSFKYAIAGISFTRSVTDNAHLLSIRSINTLKDLDEVAMEYYEPVFENTVNVKTLTDAVFKVKDSDKISYNIEGIFELPDRQENTAYTDIVKKQLEDSNKFKIIVSVGAEVDTRQLDISTSYGVETISAYQAIGIVEALARKLPNSVSLKDTESVIEFIDKCL